jgi:Tol biopolymer transport system component/tRNA A-37 threonylcarbamoyl transferase component Bud32
MALTAGEKLGPYEIVALIGAGGMGEVYKARDTRLNRIVALKVSKSEFGERFEREARAVAALNHPNVCTLFDVGPNFLVMEFVEGEMLSGPLPMQVAVGYARQIAEAIEAAHEKGIVHRDLKPPNIKITPEGTVKVLDFGLAKALSNEPDTPPSQDSPTLSLAMTRAGMILGTAAYMSPEQAKGYPADRRADIWAFGVVLYEMLVGKQAFHGDTAAETLASVLKEPISFDRLPSGTPPAMRKLLHRCLERDIRKRLQAIGEARIVLEGPMDAESVAEGPAPAKARATWVPWFGAAVLLVVLTALAFIHFREVAPEMAQVRFTISPPEGEKIDPTRGQAAQVAISPDGRQVAFVAQDAAGKLHLWVRPLGSYTAQKLDRTEGAWAPFWSPDSQSIAYFADGKLKRIPVSGGSPLTICDAANGEGGTWNRDGVIVFAPESAGPLHRVAMAGGLSTPVTTVDKAQGETKHAWPWFLPDGKRFLYLAWNSQTEKRGIWVQSLDSKERTFLRGTDGRAEFAPPDWLLFLREGTLLAQKLDLKNLKLIGDPVSVAEDIRENTSNGRNAFSVSENGVLAYRTGGDRGNVQLVWYTRDGKRGDEAIERGRYNQIELSPDDKRLVVEVRGEKGSTYDLWLKELGGPFSRLTFGADNEVDPVWSSDSGRVAFSAESKGGWDLHQVVIGSSGEIPVYADGKQNRLDDWSRDGKYLIYHTPENSVFIVPLAPEGAGGERKPQPVLAGPFRKDQFRISPDGRWVAYISVESGQLEVRVAAFPSFMQNRQLSTAGGAQPRWRRDGKELFYLAPDGKLMAVDAKSGSTLETSAPKVLFQSTIPFNGANYYYAVTGDGQRFVITDRGGGGDAVEQISLIENWAATRK